MSRQKQKKNSLKATQKTLLKDSRITLTIIKNVMQDYMTDLNSGDIEKIRRPYEGTTMRFQRYKK